MDERASSLIVGKNVRARFCTHFGCKMDHWQDMFEIVGPYQDDSLEECWNDQISHVEVYSYDYVNDPRVMMIDAYDLSVGCGAGTFPVGKYSKDDLNYFGLDTGGISDGVSTIVIPSGL